MPAAAAEGLSALLRELYLLVLCAACADCLLTLHNLSCQPKLQLQEAKARVRTAFDLAAPQLCAKLYLDILQQPPQQLVLGLNRL